MCSDETQPAVAASRIASCDKSCARHLNDDVHPVFALAFGSLVRAGTGADFAIWRFHPLREISNILI